MIKISNLKSKILNLREKIRNSKFEIRNYGGGFTPHQLRNYKTIFKKDFSMVKSGAGFTLIELLIVIAIIGILSTLLMSNFVGVRQRSRDSQRKSNLRQIQSALEIYRSDQSIYPASLIDLTLGTNPYMKKVPQDPGGSTYWNSGSYYYSNSGNYSYTIAACLENSGDSEGVATNPSGVTDCTANTYYVLDNP